MSKCHDGHAEVLPMSGPRRAGTPIAYRVLGWAEQHLREAHAALCIIREETPEGLYPRDLMHGGGRHALVNAGLLVVTAREFAKAADFLAEACAELPSHCFATLQAETAPPTILPTDSPLAAVEVFLAAPSMRSTYQPAPPSWTTALPSRGWTSSSAPAVSQLRSLSRVGGSTHPSRLSCRARLRRSRRVATTAATPDGETRARTGRSPRRKRSPLLVWSRLSDGAKSAPSRMEGA